MVDKSNVTSKYHLECGTTGVDEDRPTTQRGFMVFKYIGSVVCENGPSFNTDKRWQLRVQKMQTEGACQSSVIPKLYQFALGLSCRCMYTCSHSMDLQLHMKYM